MLRTNKQGLKDMYVVGCGPSLHGFNWGLLLHKQTIAVNGAVRDVPNPNVFVTACSGFAQRASVNKFWNVDTHKILVMNINHKSFYKVKPYLPLWDHRISPTRFDGRIGFDESNFCTGQNSGFCGMQLAVILGAKRIHLLGMDFQGGHYHDYYPSIGSKLDEFFVHFCTAISTLTQHGIEVISHSKDSRLNNVIPYEEFYE